MRKNHHICYKCAGILGPSCMISISPRVLHCSAFIVILRKYGFIHKCQHLWWKLKCKCSNLSRNDLQGLIIQIHSIVIRGTQWVDMMPQPSQRLFIKPTVYTRNNNISVSVNSRRCIWVKPKYVVYFPEKVKCC